MIAFRKCYCSIENSFINLLGRQLFSKKSIVLFKFFLDLSLFRDFIAVLLDPLCNLGRATDSLVGDHLNREFNDLYTRLLDDENNFCFVFRSKRILLGALLNTDNLRNRVAVIFRVISLVSNEASFD